MSTSRTAYPSDVSDDEWALVAPYLTLLPEDAGQREHGLREVFDGLRHIVKTGAPWRWMPHDLPPWAAVYQQAQRWLSAGCFDHENVNFQPVSVATLAGGQLAPIQPPNDGFFEAVTFIGAVPPAPADDWTRGWTSYPQR